MDYLQIAERYFKSIGLDITVKARQALAVAIGLAGSTSECDEAFVSLGLRGTNSMLSLLTDRYGLDFEIIDREVAAHSHAKEGDIIKEELRRRGYRYGTSEFSISGDEYADWFQIMDVFGPGIDDTIYVGEEGEPDPETLDNMKSMISSTVFSIAEEACRSEDRTTLETFDFLKATVELPLTSPVFDTRHLSSKRIQKEIARYKSLDHISIANRFCLHSMKVEYV